MCLQLIPSALDMPDVQLDRSNRLKIAIGLSGDFIYKYLEKLEKTSTATLASANYTHKIATL